jgi:hypothetical protein
MERSQINNLLVYDIEGVDSIERGEQRAVSNMC